MPRREKAIQASNLGITPTNDGNIIRLPIPPLTEERRRDFVKMAKEKGEDAKVAVRGARRLGNLGVEKAVCAATAGQGQCRAGDWFEMLQKCYNVYGLFQKPFLMAPRMPRETSRPSTVLTLRRKLLTAASVGV